ncbi:MAG: hypothetical protein K5641_02875 [Lachnospiraceae bacterium]|nr:hypothetical protein [Lachnospiraceae bacterium]
MRYEVSESEKLNIESGKFFAASRILLIALFFAMICLPYPLKALMGDAGTDENLEKRALATMPVFSLDTIENYPGQLENYVNDHLPLRDALIRANSRINYYALHTSANRDVILGKDGWLFYNRVSAGDPIANYKGMDLFTEEELRAIGEKLEAFQEGLLDTGKEFVLLIPPNKERIYSEYMPERYGEPASQSRVRQLVDYLRVNTNVRVCYPEEALLDAKTAIPGRNLYYKADTHWNFLGAYVGTRELFKELNLTLPPTDEVTCADTDPTISDLADLLNMRADLNTDPDFTIGGYNDHGLRQDVSEDSLFTYHTKSGDARSLFLIGDSFRVSMSAIVASGFSNAKVIHYETYTPGDAIASDADVIVWEIVERNLGDLREIAF